MDQEVILKKVNSALLRAPEVKPQHWTQVSVLLRNPSKRFSRRIQSPSDTNTLFVFIVYFVRLVGFLWHINLCRLFNAKSIFMQIVIFQTVQFSMSTQFICQKYFYFESFSLFKQF